MDVYGPALNCGKN